MAFVVVVVVATDFIFEKKADFAPTLLQVD